MKGTVQTMALSLKKKFFFTTLSCARSSQLWHGLNSIIHPQGEPTQSKNQIYPSIIRWSIHRLYLNLIQSSYCSFWKGLFCPREVPPYSWFCCLPFARWCCFGCYSYCYWPVHMSVSGLLIQRAKCLISEIVIFLVFRNWKPFLIKKLHWS